MPPLQLRRQNPGTFSDRVVWLSINPHKVQSNWSSKHHFEKNIVKAFKKKIVSQSCRWKCQISLFFTDRGLEWNCSRQCNVKCLMPVKKLVKIPQGLKMQKFPTFFFFKLSTNGCPTVVKCTLHSVNNAV